MSEDNTKTRLSRSASANLVFTGFSMLIGFFLAPFVVHRLGTDGYGVWSLVVGLLGYLGLLDLGIRQAVNRYVAQSYVVDSHGECSANLSVALTLFVVASSIAVLLSLVLSISLPFLFNIPESLVGDAQIIVALGGITVALSLVVGVFGGVVTGVQRFDVQALLDIVTTLIRAVGTVAVLTYGHGLIGLSLVHMTASVINFLGYRFAAQKLYPQVRPRIVSIFNERTNQLLSFSITASAIFVLSMVIFNSDNIVIAALLSVEAVASYAIAANLISQAASLTTAFSYLLIPRVSALASRQSSEIPAQIISVGKFAMVFILPVVISFLGRGETFLRLWMGPDIAAESGVVLTCLAFLLWVFCGRWIVISALMGLGQHRRLIPAFLIEAIANIALSVYLAQVLGILGVALGTLIPSFVVSVIIIPRYLKQEAGIDLGDYYVRTMIAPTIAALPFAVATYAMEQATTPSGLAEFFFQVLILVPLVPACAWIVCFDESDRRRITSSVQSIMGRS